MKFDEDDILAPGEQPADDRFDNDLMRDRAERAHRKPEHRRARRHTSGPTYATTYSPTYGMWSWYVVANSKYLKHFNIFRTHSPSALRHDPIGFPQPHEGLRTHAAGARHSFMVSPLVRSSLSAFSR